MVFLDANPVIYLIEQPANLGPKTTARVSQLLANGERLAVSDLVQDGNWCRFVVPESLPRGDRPVDGRRVRALALPWPGDYPIISAASTDLPGRGM
jgi:hypothetical protein